MEFCLEEGEGGCALGLGRRWGREGGCVPAPGECWSSRDIVAVDVGGTVHSASVTGRAALVEGDCLVGVHYCVGGVESGGVRLMAIVLRKQC